MYIVVMRKIILFNQTDNLYEYFKSLRLENKSTIIVCPSPAHADMLRSAIGIHQSNYQVITIAKFVKNELSALMSEEVLENFRGKAQLKLFLSIAFKRMLPDEGYQFFDQAFNLLTDMRSFSVSSDVLESVMDQYSFELKKAVLGMHSILEQLNYFDEHKSYFILAEKLRAGDLPIDYPQEKQIVFYGFDFLAPSQVDLLKAYAIRDDIILPIFNDVFRQKTHLDWISWIGDDEIIEVDEAIEQTDHNIKLFPKNYLSKALMNVVQKNRLTQLVLGVKNPSVENFLEVSIDNTQSKIKSEFLFDKVQDLFKLIDEECSNELSQSDFSDFIQKRKEVSIESKDFGMLRVIQLLNEVYIDWSELSDQSVIDSFDFKIFKEVVELNLPRVNFLSGDQSSNIELLGVSHIEAIDDQKESILCICSNYNGLSSSVTPYLEGVEKYLATLGPIRSSHLETSIAICKMKNFLSTQNPLILLESNFIEESLEWSQLLHYEDQSEDYLQINDETAHRYLSYNKGSKESETFRKSASRLQTYIDCPRKYKFNYIDRLSPIYSYEDQLNFLELGNVEHSIIEKYVEKYSHYAKDQHLSIINEELDLMIAKKNLALISMIVVQNELYSLTYNVIQKLCEIKQLSDYELYFEKSLEGEGISGRVDCIIKANNEIIILDFKRGAGSIPSKTDLLAFEKIQLWFYLNHYSLEEKISFGYINLAENEKSLMFSNSDHLNIICDKFSLKNNIVKDFEKEIKNYSEFEENLYKRITLDTDFIPNPKKSTTCTFCDLSRICPKGAHL